MKISILIATMTMLLALPASAQTCSTIPATDTYSANQPEPQDDLRLPDRFREEQELAAKSDADLLLLGDSVLGRWRPAWRAEDLRGISTLDLGKDGAKVAQVRWRLKNGASIREPKYIVLSVGTNDSGHNNPSTEIVSGIFTTVREVKAKYPHAGIMVLSLMPRYPKSPVDAQLEEVNSLLAQCNAGRYFFLDQWDSFADANGNLSRTLSDDGLHPNERGYKLFGQHIMSAIDALKAREQASQK